MSPDTNLFFINDRITEIGSALLYNMSNDFVKRPCSIITILEADDKGQLWFLTNRSGEYMSAGEKAFPARLKFYRKGKPFFVDVSGYATVTNDKKRVGELTGIDERHTDVPMENMMLVKLKMNKAEYHEPKPAKTSTSFRVQLKEFLNDLFKPAYNYRTFEIKPEIV